LGQALGQQRAQRVRPVQVVGAVGGHDQRAVQRPLVADQEGQQVPGGLVGPVQVLDDQRHGTSFGQVLQHHEHLLEQPGSRLSGFVRANSLTRRDFPTPASPPTMMTDGRPRVASASAVSSAASCPARPTRTGLVICAAT
jgi:hypothetical protein